MKEIMSTKHSKVYISSKLIDVDVEQESHNPEDIQEQTYLNTEYLVTMSELQNM